MRRLVRLVTAMAVAAMCLLGLAVPASADSGYDGNRAAMWALIHAQDKQPGFQGCTWFASQALWAGGLEPNSNWNGGFDATQDRGTMNLFIPGTRTARLAHELYSYLVYFEGADVVPLRDRLAPGDSAVPEARPGDLMAYDWDGDRYIDHFAVVVHIGENYYPDVAEWGTAPSLDGYSSYQMRGWSWSANHDKWLAKANPRMAVYLLEIGR